MTKKHERTTNVFAKAGLDIVTSAMCKYQQRFGLDIQCSALVLNFINIFSNGHLYRADQSMNSLPSQILERYAPLNDTLNYQEYISLLKIQINSLPFQRQLEFAVMICKKLYFDYKKFVELEQWGDADLLMDAINICGGVITQSPDIPQIKELIPKIELITPHMDDFGSGLGSYALNASAAVYETLEFIIDQDNNHIFNIGNYYTDTIDFKIQEERDLTELEIENHPLMIEAWNFIINQTKSGA